jgi:hypothetical protein
MGKSFSKKFLKKHGTLSTETIIIFSKIVELESLIIYNKSLLDYLSTHLDSNSIIIDTINQKKCLLEQELKTLIMVYLPNKQK